MTEMHDHLIECNNLALAALNLREKLMLPLNETGYTVKDPCEPGRAAWPAPYPIMLTPEGERITLLVGWNKWARYWDVFLAPGGGEAITSIPEGYDGPAPQVLVNLWLSEPGHEIFKREDVAKAGTPAQPATA